jgi:hypothetical protein
MSSAPVRISLRPRLVRAVRAIAGARAGPLAAELHTTMPRLRARSIIAAS